MLIKKKEILHVKFYDYDRYLLNIAKVFILTIKYSGATSCIHYKQEIYTDIFVFLSFDSNKKKI
jgi:hypothetical protein